MADYLRSKHNIKIPGIKAKFTIGQIIKVERVYDRNDEMSELRIYGLTDTLGCLRYVGKNRFDIENELLRITTRHIGKGTRDAFDTYYGQAMVYKQTTVNICYGITVATTMEPWLVFRLYNVRLSEITCANSLFTFYE